MCVEMMLQTSAKAVAQTVVQCIALALYLQFSRSSKTLGVDYCYCLQPWVILLPIVVVTTIPNIVVIRGLLQAKDKLKLGRVRDCINRLKFAALSLKRHCKHLGHHGSSDVTTLRLQKNSYSSCTISIPAIVAHSNLLVLSLKYMHHCVLAEYS
jgi:hypothetical protein